MEESSVRIVWGTWCRSRDKIYDRSSM